MKTNQSKNEKAFKVMGNRGNGEPYQFAWELGYVCPICHTKPNMKDYIDFEANEHTYIRFSEYNGFLWCPVCNIDLPFAFCFETYFEDMQKDKNEREWINVAIDRFLEFVTEVKERENITQKEIDL